MKTTALSLEQTPPLSVPLRFFLTAPLFAVAAALVLLWYGPVAVGSRWMPALLAVTHLLTLGFLAMVMMGAVQQLLPILMASPVPRPQLSSMFIHLLLTVGTALLASGMLSGEKELFAAAILFLGGCLIYFVGVVTYCLLRARSSHATVLAMALAIAALVVTGGLGILLASGYALDTFSVPRSLTTLHLIWGMLGWAGLLVIGVAYQVVPMFQLTPNYPGLFMRWLPPILFVGLVLWAAGRLLPGGRLWLEWAGGIGIMGSHLAFSVVTLKLQQRRRRRLTDINIDFWRLSLASLMVAMILWAAQGVIDHPKVELLFGILLVVGFAMSVVSGMLYKIVPFLIWLHLNNHMQAAGKWGEPIPNMKQILSSRYSRWQFWSHSFALLLLLLAVMWPELLRPAALAMLVTFSLLWWNLLGGVRLYRRYVRGIQ